jgi:hypothetical protein
MLKNALGRVTEAARHLDLDPGVLEKLENPRETTQARQTIRMDDGSSKSFLAWRCRSWQKQLWSDSRRDRIYVGEHASEISSDVRVV